MNYTVAEDGQVLEVLMNHRDFPATRGELKEWLCDIVNHNIGSCNTGNGYEVNVLFQCLEYIAKHEGEIHIPRYDWQIFGEP